MTPERAIAKLNGKLIRLGSDIELIRGNQGVVVRGFPRGYKLDELGDGVAQGDSEIVISPTSLVGSVFEDDLPERGDWVRYAGRRRYIENADPVLLANVVVRINLQVRG